MRFFTWLEFCGCATSTLFPVEKDLTRISTHHNLKALLQLCVLEAVSDNRTDIQAGLQHHGHLVPSLIHFPSVDAFKGEHVKNNRAPIYHHLSVGNSEDGDIRPVDTMGEHVLKTPRCAGHLEANIETFRHPELLLNVHEIALANIHR